MASTKQTVFLTGKLSWAKVLGEPRLNYGGDGKEWTFELEPDENSLAKYVKLGLADRIKGKGFNIGTKGQFADRIPFLQLKKSELASDGSPNTPIRVYNADNEPWDQKTLIGNGSNGDVKLDVRDYGAGKKMGVYPVAIRVTNHVSFQSEEFGGMDDDEKPAAAKRAPNASQTLSSSAASKSTKLDDEVPF